MSAQDAAQNLIAILGDTLRPYDTAEKIITEVKRGQPDVREKVMTMLLEFQTTVLQKKIEVDKALKEELQRLNSQTNSK